MAEKDSTPSLGGFDLLSSMLTGGSMADSDGRASVDEAPIVDPEVVKAALKDDDDDDIKTNKDDKTDDEVEVDTSRATSVDDDDSTDTDSDTDDDSGDITDSSQPNLEEYEADITSFLNDKFKEELGWEIDDDSAPKTVSEFVEFMRGVVDEASKPNYSSDEVAAFDEFVRSGGNLRDFYKTAVDGRVDTENVNMENSFEQKLILKEHYTNQGYSEDRINKLLKRHEDAGILEEEASDALELLKNYNDKTKQKLLDEQKKEFAAIEKQQQSFVVSVQDSIKNLDSILGVKLSVKDKKELEDSILTVDSDGYTPYQRKYMSDIKELLKSAFITMKGDALGTKIKEKGSSDAVKTLHDKLKANKGNKARQSGTQDSSQSSSGLSLLGSMLQGS